MPTEIFFGSSSDTSKEAVVNYLLRKTKAVKVKTTLARTYEFTLPQDLFGWEVAEVRILTPGGITLLNPILKLGVIYAHNKEMTNNFLPTI